MSKKEEKKHDELENVEHVLTTSEAFIEKYQKQIIFGVGTVVLVVLVALSINNFYLKPREVSAQNEMFKAQAAFATDSFKVALEGKGVESMGFKEIASEYSFTSSGNLAYAYAGICYYKLGQYDDAIKSLSQFDGKDNYFKTSITGLIGDCYVEKNEMTKAISYFEKAADANNSILSPVYLKKAGLVYESLKQLEEADKQYTTIKETYPKSPEASDIDKYIARVQK
jgi:tetratricopeptide (TPR) repeat protein